MTVRRQLLNFKSKSTDCRVGSGAFYDLPRFLKGVVTVPKRSVVVCRSNTRDRYGETVERSLVDAGFSVSYFCIDDAMLANTLPQAVRLFEMLEAESVTSDDAIVALGDRDIAALACWCANSWCAGTSSVIIPTTLASMVCSTTVMHGLSVSSSDDMLSLAPRAELCVTDIDLLADNSPEELREGYVELLLSMLADSRRKWDGFADLMPGILDGDEVACIEAICQAQSARKDVVGAVNISARAGLDFGLTTARALKRLLGNDIPRYQLLAEGMRFEARVAVDAVDFKVDDVFEIDDRLEDLGVDELPFDLDLDTFVDALRAERFKRSNRFMLALPPCVGGIRLATVEDEILERHARAYLASRSELTRVS